MVFKYIKGTLNFGLMLKVMTLLQLETYANADRLGNIDD